MQRLFYTALLGIFIEIHFKLFLLELDQNENCH